MQSVHPGHGLEQFGTQVGTTAIATRSVVVLAGRGLEHAHQVSHRLEGRVRLNDQGMRHGVGQVDRREVADRVKGHLAVQVGVDGQAAGTQPQGVAVPGRFGNGVQTDVAAGSRLVVNHHGLAECDGQPLAQAARNHIGCAARNKGHDQLDGPRRPGLRPSGRHSAKTSQCGAKANEFASEHVGLLVCQQSNIN